MTRAASAASFVAARALALVLGAALSLGGCSSMERAFGGGSASSPVANKPPSLGFMSSTPRPNFDQDVASQLNPAAPNDPLVYLQEAAEEATKAKQSLAAATHWSSITRAQPEDMEAAYQLGRDLRLLGRNEEA